LEENMMKKIQVSFVVDEATFQRLIDLCAERSKQLNKHVSMGHIIREAIQKYLKEGEAEEE